MSTVGLFSNLYERNDANNKKIKLQPFIVNKYKKRKMLPLIGNSSSSSSAAAAAAAGHGGEEEEEETFVASACVNEHTATQSNNGKAESEGRQSTEKSTLSVQSEWEKMQATTTTATETDLSGGDDGEKGQHEEKATSKRVKVWTSAEDLVVLQTYQDLFGKSSLDAIWKEASRRLSNTRTAHACAKRFYFRGRFEKYMSSGSAAGSSVAKSAAIEGEEEDQDVKKSVISTASTTTDGSVSDNEHEETASSVSGAGEAAMSRSRWTPAENKTLLEMYNKLIAEDQDENEIWKMISKKLGVRSPKACQARYGMLIEPNDGKKEEHKDKRLRKTKVSSPEGETITTTTTTTTGKNNKATPTKKSASRRVKRQKREPRLVWTDEEEQLILESYDELHKTHPSKEMWLMISEKLQRRTPKACMLRFSQIPKTKKFNHKKEIQKNEIKNDKAATTTSSSSSSSSTKVSSSTTSKPLSAGTLHDQEELRDSLATFDQIFRMQAQHVAREVLAKAISKGRKPKVSDLDMIDSKIKTVLPKNMLALFLDD